jgi:hypothetical protein
MVGAETVRGSFLVLLLLLDATTSFLSSDFTSSHPLLHLIWILYYQWPAEQVWLSASAKGLYCTFISQPPSPLRVHELSSCLQSSIVPHL